MRQLTDMADEVNGYLQTHAPWQLAATDPVRAAAVCTAALNAFRVLATLLQPILPQWGRAVARLLGTPALTWDRIAEDLQNCAVRKYERLVDRVEPARVAAVVEASRETLKATEAQEAPTAMSLDALVAADFAALRVVAVESPLSGKRGYLRLRLQDGERERVVIARIGEPEDFQSLVGRRVLVLANLKAKAIAGEPSEGMLLVADDGRAIPLVVQWPEGPTP